MSGQWCTHAKLSFSPPIEGKWIPNRVPTAQICFADGWGAHELNPPPPPPPPPNSGRTEPKHECTEQQNSQSYANRCNSTHIADFLKLMFSKSDWESGCGFEPVGGEGEGEGGACEVRIPGFPGQQSSHFRLGSLAAYTQGQSPASRLFDVVGTSVLEWTEGHRICLRV